MEYNKLFHFYSFIQFRFYHEIFTNLARLLFYSSTFGVIINLQIL